MKRVILAFILTLSFITALGFPMSVSYATPVNGDFSTTNYLDPLVGSDGDYYYRTGGQTSLKYHKDGTTEPFEHVNYSGPRQHYVITPDTGGKYYGYCIEQGVSYPDIQSYQGNSWSKDSYFKNLPKTVRTGIMLATIFGRQPGKTVPVANCNDDDWYWATQIIIWEYQQQLRLSPTKIHGNGCVSATYFKNTLDGRPAEKCYNYMLDAMAKYQEIPSFAANVASEAPIHVLKWDCSKMLWSLTIKDTNKIGDSLTTDDSKLKIQRNENEYTFTTTSNQSLDAFEFTKDVSLPSHEMLIWGSATGNQSIATGTADPVHFFVRFKTEQPGTFELRKTSEDQQKKGFEFRLTDADGKMTVYETDKDGIITAQLFPGTYIVSEKDTKKYRTFEEQTVLITENKKTVLEAKNILKKGKIQIQKNLNDTITNDIQGETGAVFQIFSADFKDYLTTPENFRDEIATDGSGKATSKDLPLGDYVIHQTVASKNVTTSADIVVAITRDLQTVERTIDNFMQKCELKIFKTDNRNNPLEGAVFTVRVAEDILKIDGTLRYKKGSLLTTVITDKNGFASTGWLYPGKYSIQEVNAPKGYQLPKNPAITVLMEAKNQTDNSYAQKITIKNNAEEEFPHTGDTATDIRTAALLSMLSVFGLCLLAYHMREENKTLH